jgi:hypothetical protein
MKEVDNKATYWPANTWTTDSTASLRVTATGEAGNMSLHRGFDAIIKRKETEKERQSMTFIDYLERFCRDENGKPIVIDNITKIMADVLDWAYRNGVHFSMIIAPGIGKSTIARHYMLYRLGNKHNLRTVVVQGELKDAVQSVALCREIVGNPEYRRVFGVAIDAEKTSGEAVIETKSKKKSFTRSEWYLKHDGQAKDPQMQAKPVELSGESLRADIVLFDDIVGEKNAHSVDLTRRVENAFWNTWVDGRMSNGGWCVYIQNVRSATDLAHKLREDHRFLSMWIGVEDNLETMFVDIYNPRDSCPFIETPSHYNATFIESMDEDGLHKTRYHIPKPTRMISRSGKLVNRWDSAELAAINPDALRKLYMLKASRPEDLMFPEFERRKFMGYSPTELSGIQMIGEIPLISLSVRHRYIICGGLDWSASKRSGKALTFILRDTTTGRYVPIYHKRIKGTIIDLVSELDRLWIGGFEWDMLINESNSIQEELGVAIKALAGKDANGKHYGWAERITNFQTTADKWSIENGLPQLNVAMYEGRLLWFENMKQYSFDWVGLENAMLEMRLDTTRMTPDSIMSLWFAWRGHQKQLGGNYHESMMQNFAGERISARPMEKWKRI